jgi:predicted AAA+ superfamily ATPase
MYQRLLDPANEVREKSIYLFGARQTGKTTLLVSTLPGAVYYDLLLSNLFLDLSRRPHLLREQILAQKERIARTGNIVIIDEIQKLPALLDEVHHLIEKEGIIFILTGSSPRKLKRSRANLLGGRARTRHLFPLVSQEIPDFDLLRVLNYGTIPSIYLSDDPVDDLNAYCGDYLQQEIQAEGLVRNIGVFSRFLQTAALCNGEMINFESLASDSAVTAQTIREYFSILEDTLVGAMLPPFKRVVHRKAVSKAKFYFFDIGVANILAQRPVFREKSELFGKAFEHFIFCELRAYREYRKDRRPLTFWRDYQGHEVDFLLGDELAVEVKATSLATEKHTKGLRMLSEDVALKNKVVVSLDAAPRRIGDIDILPWSEFLDRLWVGAF